jgi:hypothetical protein
MKAQNQIPPRFVFGFFSLLMWAIYAFASEGVGQAKQWQLLLAASVCTFLALLDGWQSRRSGAKAASMEAPITQQEPSLSEILAKEPALPKVDELIAPDPTELSAIVAKVFAKAEWILLQHGTVLSRDPAKGDSRPLDEIYNLWVEFGPMMDDGRSYILNDGNGWYVTCGAFPDASTIVIRHELESNCEGVKVTVFAFVKRKADFKHPLIIARSTSG